MKIFLNDSCPIPEFSTRDAGGIKTGVHPPGTGLGERAYGPSIRLARYSLSASIRGSQPSVPQCFGERGASASRYASCPQNHREQHATSPNHTSRSTYANTRRAELILIARSCPFDVACATIEFGRPTLERNHLRKFFTQSTHSSAEISSRSNRGSNSAGVEPHLSVRICRAVQSSNCRYSDRLSVRNPLFDARRSVFFARTA